MESKKIWRIAIVIVIILAIIGLIYLLRNALLPVFIALLLAYLLDPIVARLESRRINRSVAIFILAALVVIILGGALTILIIQAQREVVELYHNLPDYLARVQDKVAPLVKEYLGRDLPGTFQELLSELKDQVSKIDPATLKPASKFVSQLTSKTLALIGWLLGLLIIPVFLFYFLRDWNQLKTRAKDYIPLAYRDYLVEKFLQIDEALSAFIRGQLTVCLILGIFYSIGLVMVGVDLAVVIGMLSGLAFIVPYFGTVIGIILATIMSLLENGISWQLLGAWLVFAVVQFFESYFITPRIVGKKIGLKPVAVILAVLIGADLFGFLGILIAVPTAAVIKVFLKDALDRYKKSSFFLEKPPEKS